MFVEVDFEDGRLIQIVQLGARFRHDIETISTQIRMLIDGAQHQVDAKDEQEGDFASEC